MSAPPVPARRRTAAGILAALSCAAVLALSACDTSSESASAAPSGGEHREGGHTAPHSGTHPTSHHTSAPSGPTGEFNPRNCPTGLVC